MSSASTDRNGFRLRTRILAATTAMLALAMTAAFLWSVLNLRNILELQNHRFLEQKLVELLSALREQSSDPTGAAFIAEMRRESEAHAETGLFAIVRRDNHVEFFPDNEMPREVDQKLFQSDPDRIRSRLTLQSDHSQILVLRSQQEKTSNTVWTIDLGLRMDQTESTIRDFYQRLILGGVAFLMMSLIGGVFLTGLSLRPIARAIDTARRLNPDDLTARLPLSRTGDELDQLSMTINALLDRVAQKHEQLIRFTSDASHELRSPLAALRTAIEIALQQPRSNEGYRELLGSLGEQCQRLTDLVNTLLLLARADAGQVQLRLEPVDLALLVRESVELFQPLIDEHHLSLDCQLPERLIIRADRLRLGQLITNLLDNAIKFTNSNGCIKIALRSDNNRAELTITDTGIGIAEDRLPYIFDRFYRVDGARSRGGTGLGLSICHWIVLAHSGTITVSSIVKQGTTFRVELAL